MLSDEGISALLKIAGPIAATFLLGAAWQSWRASSSEIANQISDIIKDLKQLEEFSTEYWINVKSKDSKKLEARIRGLTFQIAGYEHFSHKIFQNDKRKFEVLLDKLISECTGGAFESSKRIEDAARAIKIQSIISQIISLCRSSRQRSAGMGAALSNLIAIAASPLNILADWVLFVLSAIFSFIHEKYKEILLLVACGFLLSISMYYFAP